MCSAIRSTIVTPTPAQAGVRSGRSRWSASTSRTRRTLSRAPYSSRTAGCGFGCGVDVSCREPLVVVGPEVTVVDHPLLRLFLIGLTVAHIVEVVGSLTVSERVVAVD